MGAKKSPLAKLPRATLEQKIKILDYYQKSQRPQLDTVEKFKDEVAISTSTFNEWVKHEDEYRQRYQQLLTEFQKNAKRKVKYKYDKINRAMDLLVQQKLERGEAITEPILRGYWQVYAHQFGVDNPKRLIGFSHGWLSQFKKRHGLSRKRDGKDGDATLTNNEKLLAVPAETPPPLALILLEPTLTDKPNPSPSKSQSTGPQFQPQQTLSFPNQYAYYDDPDAAKKNQRQQDLAGDGGDSRLSLLLAMSLPMASEKRPSAADIEKFIFSIADHFFHEHQYLYPQTVKMYQEFKSSFLSERLIDLRSAKEGGLQPHIAQAALQLLPLQLPNLRSQTVSLGQSPMLALAQMPVQTQIQNQIHNQIQSQILAQLPGTQLHRSSRIGRLGSKHHSLKHVQKLTHKPQTRDQGHGEAIHGGQAGHQVHQSHQPHQTHQGQSSAKHRYMDPAMRPLPLPQLLSLHRLHPLARNSDAAINQNMSQLRDMHQGLTALAPPSSQANFDPPGEVRDPGLDEMFNGGPGNRQYGDGQWQTKSSLRKIWEQNKIMLL